MPAPQRFRNLAQLIGKSRRQHSRIPRGRTRGLLNVLDDARGIRESWEYLDMDFERRDPLFAESRPLSETFGDHPSAGSAASRRWWSAARVCGRRPVRCTPPAPLRSPPLAGILARQQTPLQKDEEPRSVTADASTDANAPEIQRPDALTKNGTSGITERRGCRPLSVASAQTLIAPVTYGSMRRALT